MHVKINWKSKEARIAITVFITVAAIIIFSRVIDDIDDLLGVLSRFFGKAGTVLAPFVMGAIICYILLPIVRFFDNKVLKFLKLKNLRRGISVLITYALLLAGVSWLISYLIPILVSNITDFVSHLPGYLETGEAFAVRIMDEIPMLGIPAVEKAAESTIARGSEIIENAVAKLGEAVPNLLLSLPGYIKKFTGIVTDSFVAVITSIYLLMDVDRLKVSAKRLTVATLGEKRSSVALMFVQDADRIFGQYIRARLLTSTLVFILSFIGFTAYGVPYATLFALVGGITNIIPFYGPIIGFLIIVPLVLLISPEMALFAGIFVTVLQQLEGYLIDPMIMGDSVDMRPFWVLLAVTVGGVFGLKGMVLAVPVAAFIGTQLSRFTASRLGPKPEEEKVGLFRRKEKKAKPH